MVGTGRIVKYISFICLILNILPQVSAQNKDFVFEQITSEAGITFNAVNSIVEDDYGFIWFGTASGLYYYNTSEITQYNFSPTNDNSPPSDKILKVYKDRGGRIWICTGNGLAYFDEYTNSFSRISFRESDRFLNNMTVSSIVEYAPARYLVIIDEILYHFDIKSPVLREVELQGEQYAISLLERIEEGQIFVGTTDGLTFVMGDSISDFNLLYKSSPKPVTAICKLGQNIWIGQDGAGVQLISMDGELITQYSEKLTGNQRISSDRVRDIVQRKNHEIWIGSSMGISVISGGTIQNIDQNQLHGLPHLAVFDLYVDTNNGTWVGTWSGGLAYYNDYNFKFPHIRVSGKNESPSRSVVSSFAENSDGTIWIGIENSDLKKFDPENMIFISEDHPANKHPVSRVKSISTDKNNQHWMGTLYEGLWSVDQHEFKRRSNHPVIFSSILAVDNGVWMGTRLSGLIFYDINANTFEYFRAGDKTIGSISSDYIWNVFMDSKENLWICSDFGLSLKPKNSSQFQRFFYNVSSNSLSRNLNYTINEDKNGKIWIGTAGDGIDIFDPETKSFHKFSLNASIANAEVYSILEDLEDNIWFSTNQGIYLYYPQNNTLRNFTEQDGILGKQYHPNSGFISSTGKLYFGGGNGFNLIDPSTVKQNPITPEVFLSNVLINNKSVEEHERKLVNSSFPAAMQSFDLPHNQNSLSIDFVANNFIKSSRNKFRYRMKDYLDEWIEINHGSTISFTKIPPGDYVLEVMASNNDGIWSDNAKEFHIRIAPPIFLSWYAYIFYSLLLITISGIVFRELRFREKSRAERMLFAEKVKFFTNLSHEFRTPLTLILSPLNGLMNTFKHDTSTVGHLQIIKRNADRLLRLTNQMLDFRLIELNKMKLKRSNEDIINLCRSAFDCFEYEATEKQINCIFNSHFKSYNLYIDAKKIEKVVYNILSNAFKHCPEKGQIILSIEETILSDQSYAETYFTGERFTGPSLEIKIRDNGTGIKSSDIPLIFDRFFIKEGSDSTGLGIGLHMCQEYIHLHGGNILVNSEVSNGTIFTVNIPLDSHRVFEKEDVILQYHFDNVARNTKDGNVAMAIKGTNRLILYVEDNDELRMYYKHLLSSRYKVLTAKNGYQAFEITSEIVADLIISDIMMPGMDGLELADSLRKQTKTSHIPIILLTALTDKKYKIDSMSKGVHSFITKPVDEAFLFAKIENIFKAQDRVHMIVESETNSKHRELDVHESFIEKAHAIVEKNLQNPDFSIKEFSAQLNISRSSLQRRLKAEVNLSPTEFIRDLRLKKAVKLLKSSTHNIDEVGLLVGFNSTSYFIRSFKKKYGKTPYTFQSELKVLDR